METKSVLELEIQRKDEEKFLTLVDQVQKTQAELTVNERKEFEKLWRIYCNSLNEIATIRNDIENLHESIASRDKSSMRKIWYVLCAAVVLKLIFLSGEFETSILFLVCASYFFYEKITLALNKSQIKSELVIFESFIRQIRLNLSFLGIYGIKFENEYIKASNNLLRNSSEVIKKIYEEYNNLHFTYVSNELLKIVKSNEA